MFKFQRHGYRSKRLGTDIALGVADGLDNTLWAYVYASIIFAGALSHFVALGVAAVLFGWTVLRLFVALTSKEPLHIANLDDQSVVIFGSISLLALTDYESNDLGQLLATLLTIMSLTSVLFATCCYFVGRYKLSRLLDLLPYPVICGFMASVGWLLFNAGVQVATGSYIDMNLFNNIQSGGSLGLLGVSVFCGAMLTYVLARVGRFWAVPLALFSIVLIYYGMVEFFDFSYEKQLAGGWLFERLDTTRGGVAVFGRISIADIDWQLVIKVIPEICTIVFLALLYTSMTLATLKIESSEKLDVSDEFKVLGGANMLCAVACSPPGYTDIVSTKMYRNFGASSRWLVIVSSGVSLLVLFFGSSLINYMPKVLVTAGIFLFAFQTWREWLLKNARGFRRTDYMIVCTILGTVIFVDFMQGILMGVILTVLLFVVRYSMIRVIESRQTLESLRSSVERSSQCNEILAQEGDKMVVYNLRGYIFFGSANRIVDTVLDDSTAENQELQAIVMDMSHVTGIDISALNKFSQIKKVCEARNTLLIYAAVPLELKNKMMAVNGANQGSVDELFFDQVDFAIEFLEEKTLEKNGSTTESISVDEVLFDLIKNKEKVSLIVNALKRLEYRKGDCIFSQGDENDGFYILESGALHASVEVNQKQLRVKKFRAGSLVGELSAYLRSKSRTATIVADQDSIVYHLSLTDYNRLSEKDEYLVGCIHELLATALAERVNFMNHRLCQ